jgi:DNA-binding PadR family transcriptional regulator
MGRKLSSADLQLLLLTLLDEKPSHGYDLIKAIDARSNGFYVPSPGVIYPALTYLEEASEAVSEADGSRKLFRLTDAGRERLNAQRADADALLAQLDELGQRMKRVREAFTGGDGRNARASLRDLWSTFPELLDVLHELQSVLAEHRRAKREHWPQIVATLKRAAAEIREILRESDSESDR